MPEAQSSQRAILDVEDLHVRYGRFHAVKGIDLTLFPGQALALLGPNGSGKSSTLSAIAGLVPADTGRIRIGGIDFQSHPDGCRSLIGLVPQEFAFYEELSSRENLMFVGRLYGLHGTRLRRRVREALEFVSLGDAANRAAGTLSGGMQRRLNLACAILHEPQLLLLDEPTVGLDITSRDAIYHLLEALADQGCAMILTTHHLHEAQHFCDRIALMRKGQIIAQGTLEELDRLSLNSKIQVASHPEWSDETRHDLGHELRGPRGSVSDLEGIYARLVSGIPGAAPGDARP